MIHFTTVRRVVFFSLFAVAFIASAADSWQLSTQQAASAEPLLASGSKKVPPKLPGTDDKKRPKPVIIGLLS